jgi:hypothetical protein
MKQRWIKIDPILYEILSEKFESEFSVLKVRDIFVSRYPGQISKRIARQKTYSLFRKLLKAGMLVKHAAQNKRNTIYSKTYRFAQAQYESGKIIFDVSDSADTNKLIGNSTEEQLRLLRGKLKHYRELLDAAVAESEEYKALYEVFPDLKQFLENKYLEARARSSKCLGQLNAVKTVISQIRSV